MSRTNWKLNLLFCGLLLALIVVSEGCGGGSSSGSSGNANPAPGPPPAPSPGANVPENLETVVVYVDGASGNDNNNGSQSSPFRTINKALAVAGANNQKKVGTQVNVNPGIYREKLNFPPSQTSLPFTLQATTPGSVFISGADSLPGSTWTVSGYGPEIYTNSATSRYIFGACGAPPGWPPVPAIVSRREMVFINGFRLNQVMFENQMQPGTFWADAGETNLIYIWPPHGTNMADADIEVATTSRSPLMSTDGVNNFVVRGLTFEYDASCTQTGPRVANGTNILIDNDKFLWNNNIGFSVFAGVGNTPGVGTAERVTVQNSVADHNGQIGFSGYKVKYALYQNDESSYNGWRGAEGGYYEVGFDGSYFFLYHNSNFNGYTAHYNECSGVHFDTDNASDQVTGLDASGNNLEGLSIEASEGPLTVQNSSFCSNSLAAGSTSGNVSVNDSSHVTLTGNTLYNGGQEEIYILGNGRTGTNWEQPNVPLVRFNQHLTETNNTILGTANELGFRSDYKDAPSCNVPISDEWQTFGSSFSSQSNTWGDSAANNSSYPFFRAAILKGVVPLATWQASPPEGIGQDTESQFVPKATAPSECTLPKPDTPDFWLVLGPRGGRAVIAPQAGGPAIQAPVSLVSLGFTGAVSLSFDTTQEGGSPVSGVTGTFSPQRLSLSPDNFLTPAESTLTITTTIGTPDGFYTLTVTATDEQALTRTGTMFLQVGAPSTLRLSGNTSISAGSCARFQIHTVNSEGNPSDVLTDTYLAVTGTGSGRFYQDPNCTTLVDFNPVNAGCPAGIEMSQGDDSVHFSGLGSIFFMDPKVEDLNVTISDEANVLKPVTTPIQIH